MVRTLPAVLILSALALPTVSSAQMAPMAASTEPLTGNLSLSSSYRMRGIDWTFGKPALQGGVDYNHASGFYVGNWNTNVSQGAGFPGGNLEMDFYGGWKRSWGDFGLDLGAMYWYYPGTNAGPTIPFSPFNNKTMDVATGRVDNTEISIGGSWKFLSLKYSQSVGDYFSAPGTKNSNYLDFGVNYGLGSGWGINAHVGHLNIKNMINGSYTDWKLGVTKDIAGWILAVSYIGTNAKGDCNPSAVNQFYCFFDNGGTSTKDAGRDTLPISISKMF